MANVKGKIAKLSKNGGGYWSAGVITGEVDGKSVWGNISFADKSDKLLVNGIEIKPGMLADCETEGQWGNFVSGTFNEPEKKTYSGGSKGGFGKGGFTKSTYDPTGQAVGGAVNRANELVAAGIINPVGAAVVALAQYYVSETLIKAASNTAGKLFIEHFAKVDVNDITQVIHARTAFEKALEASKPKTATQPAPTQQEAPVDAPKQQQQAPVVQQTTQVHLEEEGGFDFDDTPNF
jgi:hypothetical protein